MRDVFTSLHQEVEIAVRARNQTGHARRKVPRKQQKARTKKRRLLEQADAVEQAVTTVVEPRLRGSKVAIEAEVVNGSLAFPERNSDNADNIHAEVEDEVMASQNAGSDEEAEEEGDSDGEFVSATAAAPTKTARKAGESPPKRGKKRVLYKLKNFKSHRMALRHGDALGAHARGQRKVAVQKLKQVARDAPSAPQVYSSLGMVYEDMLHECKKRGTLAIDEAKKEAEKRHDSSEPDRSMDVDPPSADDDDQVQDNEPPPTDSNAEDANVQEQFTLAKKAYGSYHTAAILCKKDFSLWERAADSAVEIADLHSTAMTTLSLSEAGRKYHVSEKERWLKEAKMDYRSADNLHPPGIDIPAKLASVHMELGNLAEALTILTDIKKKREFQGSYKAWLLYANLMLRIGHECTQWNRGIQTNKNYMFRRWLRKLSTTFDWQERRLQGLSLALHAAAGSSNCERFMEWTTRRAQTIAEEGTDRTSARTRNIQADEGKKRHIPQANVNDEQYNTRAGSRKRRSIFRANENGFGELSAASSEDDDEEEDDHDTSVVKIRDEEEVHHDSFECDSMLPGNDGIKDPRETDDPNDADDTRVADLKNDEEFGWTSRGYNTRANKSRVNGEVMQEPPDISNEDEYEVDDNRLGHRQSEQAANGEDDNVSMTSIVDDSEDLNGQQVSNTGEHTTEMSIHSDDEDSYSARKLENAKCPPTGNVEAQERINHPDDEFDCGQNGPDIADHPKTAAPLNDRSRTPVVDETARGVEELRLPISASCKTVCNIASELLKHCHGLELYEGGRLVGEVVACYFKERAMLRDRRLEKRNSSLPAPRGIIGLFEQIPEDMGDESDADDADTPYLSDDDDLDVANDELIESFRRGVLPPELKVLYGLCLIGEGGKNFVASRCLEAIDDLEQETHSWLTEETVSSDLTEDYMWQMFLCAMTEPLGRTSAYAFVYDVLRKSDKQPEWASYFSPLFSSYVKELEEMGLLVSVMNTEKGQTHVTRFRRNQIIKIITGAASFRLFQAEGEDQPRECSAEEIAVSTVTFLARFLPVLWNVESDGSISARSMEVLNVLCRAFSILSESASEGNFCLTDLSEEAARIMSMICRSEISSIDTGVGQEEFLAREWGAPIPANWQTVEQEIISTRCYNLCVASCVSLFSGWEYDEFSLKLLRRDGRKHFGIKLEDGKVTGCLPLFVEEELANQWEKAQSLLPWLAVIDFKNRLAALKRSSWYQEARHKWNAAAKKENVAVYGEEDGIRLLLTFSKLCLLWAKEVSSPRGLLLTSLSILLPMTQFCLEERIWQSDMGKTAGSIAGVDDWRQSCTNKILIENMEEDLTFVPPPRRKMPTVEKELEDWIQGGENLLSDLVVIPVRDLQEQWDCYAEETDGSSTQDDDVVVEVMRVVHESTRKLRSCFTDNAIGRACLQLAAALLELAGCGWNPFLCIQQAAIFASQGSKGGSNDEFFKHPFPQECTPLQALVIVGRAECLQAIQFPSEAAFLCSYVAGLTRCHHESSERWKVVGILAHNLSVSTRLTARSLPSRDRMLFSSWDQEIMEELERARSQGMAWKKMLDEQRNGENIGSASAEPNAAWPPQQQSGSVAEDDVGQSYAETQAQAVSHISSNNDSNHEDIIYLMPAITMEVHTVQAHSEMPTFAKNNMDPNSHLDQGHPLHDYFNNYVLQRDTSAELRLVTDTAKSSTNCDENSCVEIFEV